MKLQLDIAALIKTKISAHQWVIAQLIILDQMLLNAYIKTSPIKMIDASKLIEQKIIEQRPLDKDEYEITDLTPTPKWAMRYQYASWFDEFSELYPKVVVRPDGLKDHLHTDKSRCKQMYRQRVKTIDDHTAVMSTLKKEVTDAALYGKLPYFKRMPRWIAAESWLNEQNDKSDGNNIADLTGYGTDLI